MSFHPLTVVSFVFKSQTASISSIQHGQCVQSAHCSESSSLTLFTEWFSILQVEGVVSDWLLTGSAQKAVDMPRLFEGIYHLLDANANNVVSWRLHMAH